MPLASHFVAIRSALPWLACALSAFVASLAFAQPLSDVVVVPVGVPDANRAIIATSMLEAELANAHVSLTSLHDARDRFTARSRPPQMASDSDVDVLAKEAREAIEHVAFGRTAAAQKSVREVIARAERTLESLNRETATARHILDTCLTLVRSTLQAEKRELALEQAMRCRRLVPDLAPSETAHPANVVGVLAEADNLLRRMRTGRLQVHSTPESNCSVYLNGRHLGNTPFQLDRAATGEYRVQVECGRSVGRVHVVQLGDQPASLTVDTEFDLAVASDPRLLLRYARAEDAHERAVAHALLLGRQVGVDDILLVSIEGDRAELVRAQVSQGRLVGRASVPWNERRGFAQPALERAITTLAEARIDGTPSFASTPSVRHASSTEQSERAPKLTEPSAEAASPAADASSASDEATFALDEPAPGEPAPTLLVPPHEERPFQVRKWVGYSLLAGAGVLVALGVAYDWRAQILRDDLSSLLVMSEESEDPTAFSAELEEKQQRWEKMTRLRWLGVGGSALATIAAVLLVDPRPNVPWWGYMLGTAGVALAGVGVYQLVIDGDCLLYGNDELDKPTCRRTRDSAARGVLLTTLAAPFLAVPITQLARRTPAREVALLPTLDAGALRLVLHARF